MQTTTAAAFADQARAVVTHSPDDLLTAAGVRAACGGISEMTLWRWVRDLSFPEPDVMIAKRRFWRRATVQGWIAAQASTGAAA